MIMPNKFLKEEDSLLGSCAVIFDNLNKKQSLSDLWECVKDNNAVYNYERFILSLDMLYTLNLVEFKENNLMRVKK